MGKVAALISVSPRIPDWSIENRGKSEGDSAFDSYFQWKKSGIIFDITFRGVEDVGERLVHVGLAAAQNDVAVHDVFDLDRVGADRARDRCVEHFVALVRIQLQPEFAAGVGGGGIGYAVGAAPAQAGDGNRLARRRGAVHEWPPAVGAVRLQHHCDQAAAARVRGVNRMAAPRQYGQGDAPPSEKTCGSAMWPSAPGASPSSSSSGTSVIVGVWNAGAFQRGTLGGGC